jgi:hypothetical protein
MATALPLNDAAPGVIRAMPQAVMRRCVAASVGRYRTYVFTREFSEHGALDAFRHGSTLASDSDGNVYGDRR